MNGGDCPRAADLLTTKIDRNFALKDKRQQTKFVQIKRYLRP